MRFSIQNSTAIMFIFCLGYLVSAGAEEGGGANASDPTAAVNFVDFRIQTFDLIDGADRDRYAVEGAYVITPQHKLTYEINYWKTGISGKDESGLESVKSALTNHPLVDL